MLFQTDVEQRIARVEGMLATLKMLPGVEMSTIASFENEIKELKSDYHMMQAERSLV